MTPLLSVQSLQVRYGPIGLSIVVVVLLFRPNGLIPSAALKAEKV